MKFSETCVTALVLVPLLAWGRPNRMSRTTEGLGESSVEVAAGVVAQEYCYADAEVFTLHLRIKLRFKNASERNIILSRRPGLVFGPVAATLEAGHAGVFEDDPRPHVLYPGNTRIPTFGTRPDPEEFVVLAPGRSRQVVIWYSVPVRHSDSKPIPGTVRKGPHVLQLNVDTWPYPMSAGKIQLVKERWKTYGDLSTGRVTTDFFPFFVPQQVKVQDCYNPPRKRTKGTKPP